MWERVKSVVGGAIATIFIGGIAFVQCALPFFRDNSETWTCDSDGLRQFCDDEGTLANFFVAMCGEEDLTFKGNLIQTIGGDGTDPDELELLVKCGSTSQLRLSMEEGDDPPESIDEMRRFTRDDDVLDIWEQWLSGALSTSEARKALLSR